MTVLLSNFSNSFWPDLGHFILRSLNFAYRNDCLSVTQKQGIITCIPKPNKSRNFLKKKLETDFIVKCHIWISIFSNSKPFKNSIE